jgi:hypothetical protein
MSVGNKLPKIIFKSLVVHQLYENTPGKRRALLFIVRRENHKVPFPVGYRMYGIKEREER